MNRAVAPFPKLLVSSVVRGTRQGDSHGGLYLVDMESGRFEQKLDWNNGAIDFGGRGADRGLRGIAVIGEEIFIAASDELFVFDPDFRIVASYRNPHLKHCHEICEHGSKLWLTSTGFDSVLRLDLATRAFDFGIRLLRQAGRLNAMTFDPRKDSASPPSNEYHVNNVHAAEDGIYISGRHLPALVRLTQSGISVAAPLPAGTHNARPFRGGVIFNDTESDSLAWVTPTGRVAIPVPRYEDNALLCSDLDESGLARQAFGRGLCPLSDNLVAGGSSPTTVSIYDLSEGRRVMSVNLTMDVRNAAHGLAAWPF
jgi:hypothetical protein